MQFKVAVAPSVARWGQNPKTSRCHLAGQRIGISVTLAETSIRWHHKRRPAVPTVRKKPHITAISKRTSGTTVAPDPYRCHMTSHMQFSQKAVPCTVQCDTGSQPCNTV